MSSANARPLKRVLPFYLVVVVDSILEEIAQQPGYRHTAKAIGLVDGKIVNVLVTKDLGWNHADHLSSLQFDIAIDCKSLLPLVNQKNRA